MNFRFYAWLDDLARDSRVHQATFKAAYVLARKADDKGRAWPSQETIRRDSGLSDNGVRKAVRQLMTLGVVNANRVIAGDKLPSGFPSTRTRFVYDLKSLSPAHSSGEHSSGEHSSPEQSEGTPLHRVKVSPAQSAGVCHDLTNDLANDLTKEEEQLSLLNSSSPPGKPKGRKTQEGSSDERVRVVAKKYLEVLGAVTGRSLRSVTNIAKPIRRRLMTGTPSWQIICVPILQSAINHKPMTELKNIAEVLLRDGEHAKAHSVYGTVGAKNWIDDAYLAADTLTLDRRLTDIAAHYGLTEDISRTGCRLTEASNEG